ncbi:unnamed protein product [Musa acuminata subsp. burmannicoides]
MNTWRTIKEKQKKKYLAICIQIYHSDLVLKEANLIVYWQVSKQNWIAVFLPRIEYKISSTETILLLIPFICTYYLRNTKLIPVESNYNGGRKVLLMRRRPTLQKASP